jgi:hypothetical protein
MEWIGSAVIGVPRAVAKSGCSDSSLDVIAGQAPARRGLGVAMGNGTESAKQAAKRVIGDNGSDALAGLIEELFPE